MFADPITVTINAVAKNLTRINSGDPYSSEYWLKESNTGDYRLKIRHSTYTGKDGIIVDRHNVELVHTVYATAAAKQIVRKVYAVFEAMRSDTVTDPVYVANGLFAFLTAANVTKLANLES